MLCRLDVQKLSNPDVRLKYQKENERLLNATNTSNQGRWTNIVNSSTKSAAEKVVGFVKSGKRTFDNTEIKELSDQQKKIKLKMENNKDSKNRNKTINKLHKLVKRQEQQNIERQIQEIENTKEDSTRIFKAIKTFKDQSLKKTF